MEYQKAAKQLLAQDNILIISHRRPDGDTIGCACALCLGLRQAGKEAYVLENPEAHALFAPYLVGLCAPCNYVPQYIVTVDTAATDLFPANAVQFKGCVDLAIDHHGSYSAYAKEACVEPRYAACGELIYYILREMGTISPQMAKFLYVAISTDTGCFVFSNTSAETHRITADLMDIGCDHQAVNKRHFRTKSLARLRLESRLTQDMVLMNEGRTVIAAITLDMIRTLGANEEDLENITSFMEHLQGAENAVTLRELAPDEYKISLRSGPSLNASVVCARFGGGGHPAAAGCTIMGSLDEVSHAIIEAIVQVSEQ